MTAADDLIDVFDRFGPVLEPDDTRRLLGALARAHHRTIVRWLVDTAGTDPVVAALADTVDPGNLVAGMVEQGVLMQATDGTCGALLWHFLGEAAVFDERERPDDAVALYRAVDTREADRG